MNNRRNGPRPVLGGERRRLQVQQAHQMQLSSPEPLPVVVVETYFNAWQRWGKRLLRTIEVIALLLAIIGVPMFFLDLQDRQKNQITAAWQLVTTRAPGNSGKGPALEYLNSEDTWCPEWAKPVISKIFPIKERISLAGIDLSSDRHGGEVDLRGVNLIDADLEESDLRGVLLKKAKLNGANLYDVDFRGSSLTEADFSEASLIGANLRDMILFHINFSGANLVGADLSNTTHDENNFNGASLETADLSRASLFDSNFSGANLGAADFSGARGLSRISNCENSWRYKTDDPLDVNFPCKPYRTVLTPQQEFTKGRVYLRQP